PYAAFMAASSRRDIGILNLNLLQALAWGGFDLTGQFDYRGFLYGDGSITVGGGRQRFSLYSHIEREVVLAGCAVGNVAVSPNLIGGGGQVGIRFTTPPSVATVITFTLD